MLWFTTAAAPVPPSAEELIRSALAGWSADFNAGRSDRICDLFAKNLRYDYRGLPERGYQDMCNLLQRALADPARRFSYVLNLKEVVASGDLAVARVVWTLTVAPADGSPPTSSLEYGMDVFRKQPDGTWKIIRFIAYDEP